MAKRPAPGNDNEVTKMYRKSKPWADILHSAVKTHGCPTRFPHVISWLALTLRNTDLDESKHPVAQLLEVNAGEMEAMQAWLEGTGRGFPSPSTGRTPAA